MRNQTMMSTAERLKKHLQFLRDDLTAAFEALDKGEGYEDYAHADDYLWELPLELRPGTVVFTVGGPYIAIETGPEGPAIHGYWGSDHEVLEATEVCQRVFEFFPTEE